MLLKIYFSIKTITALSTAISHSSLAERGQIWGLQMLVFLNCFRAGSNKRPAEANRDPATPRIKENEPKLYCGQY